MHPKPSTNSFVEDFSNQLFLDKDRICLVAEKIEFMDCASRNALKRPGKTQSDMLCVIGKNFLSKLTIQLEKVVQNTAIFGP